MAANLFSANSQNGHIIEFKCRFSGYEFSSYELSASENCRIKWDLLVKVGCGQVQFGLRRIDLVKNKKIMHVSCIIKVFSSENKLLKKLVVVESAFECGESKYFDDGIYNETLFYRTLHTTGYIIIHHCCEEKVNKVNMADNITQLQKDFRAQMQIRENSDVTLNVNNEIVPAHKFILRARSPVFNRMFQHAMLENKRDCVRLEDMDKPMLEKFLCFLYTGILEDCEFNTVFDLYSIADKFEVATLQKTCRHILTSQLSRSTATLLLKLADLHSDEELKESTVNYICNNFSDVVSNPEWDKLLQTDPRLATNILKKVSTNISN